MSGRIEAKLAELGITLPAAPAPAAAYVPYVIAGDLVFVSGQVSVGPDGPIKGKLGDDMSIEQGQAAAKVCALVINGASNFIGEALGDAAAHARAAVGTASLPLGVAVEIEGIFQIA